LPVTFVIANLFTRYVDSPSIVFSKQAGDFLLNIDLFQEKLSKRIIVWRDLIASTIKRQSVDNILDEQNEA
jgi:hypothetical protein